MPDTLDGYRILAQAETRGVRKKQGPGERSQWHQEDGKKRDAYLPLNKPEGFNRGTSLSFSAIFLAERAWDAA